MRHKTTNMIAIAYINLIFNYSIIELSKATWRTIPLSTLCLWIINFVTGLQNQTFRFTRVKCPKVASCVCGFIIHDGLVLGCSLTQL